MWAGYAEYRTGYDYFYQYVLPSAVDEVINNFSKFDEATTSACARGPALCPCTTYPDIWSTGTVELVGAFDTFEAMNSYSCDTYQWDPNYIICTMWEVDTDPKYWDNINGICGN